MHHRRTRPPKTPRLLVLCLLAASACDQYVGCAPILTTDAGQLEFHDQAITVGAGLRLRQPSPLIEGARWCPAIRCGADVDGCEDDDGDKLPDAAVAACFDAVVSGPAMSDGPCLRMMGPGRASWAFSAVPCAAADNGYAAADDAYAWDIVAPAEVTASFSAPGDAFAIRSLVDSDGAPLPDADALQPEQVANAVADTPVPFAVVLRHPDHEAAVGWNPTNWDVLVSPQQGEPPEVSLEDFGLLTVTIAADARAHIAIVARPEAGVTQTLDVGVVAGVAASELSSLRIVAAYAEAPEDSGLVHGPVAGARAVVQTADGRRVYGADVSWSITEGSVPLWRDESLPWTPDYIALAERDGASCHEPPKRSRQYVATVRAELDGLSDEVSVQWTEAPPQDGPLGSLGDIFSDPPERSERCAGPGFPPQSGCACTTKKTSTPVGMLALFALGALAFSRRRSRR